MAGDSRRDIDAHFDVLIARERAALVRAAAKILGGTSDAEDLVQETLTAVWQRTARIPPGKLRAYLFQSVRFNALKRRARARGHVSLETLPEVAAPQPDPPVPHETIGPMELERALVGLPRTQQVVLRMRYYVGMTFREIGRTLAISTNTASSRCRYALAALRRTFGADRTGSTRKRR